MKGKKLIVCIVCALLSFTVAFSACTQQPSGPETDTPPTHRVTDGDKCIDLEIVKQPTKTEYKVGEKFSTKGLVFNAIYQNGFDGDYGLVGGDLDGFVPRGPLTEDVTEITLKFEGFEKNIPITVLPKVLKSVEITREPDIKSYTIGDALDLNGLIVAADYEEGFVEDERGFVITDKDGNEYEHGTALDKVFGSVELFVNVTAGSVTKTDSFTIGVYDSVTVQVEDLWKESSGTEKPTDKSFTVITGGNLKTEFVSDNKGTHILNDCTYTGTGYLGNINKGMNVEFNIYSDNAISGADLVLIASSTCNNSQEKKMDDMQVNKMFRLYIDKNGDGEYSADEEISIADYVVIEGKPHPTDGSSIWTNWADVPLGKIDLNEGYTRVKLECIGSVKDTSNNNRVPNVDKLDVRLDGSSSTRGDMVNGITVITQPAKTAYTAGEAFDPAGLVFSASYMNGYAGDTNLGADDVKVLTGSPLNAGMTEVRLKYKTYVFTVNVTVTAGVISAVELTRNPTITSYAKGSALNLGGLIVKATYENGYVDENAINYTVKDSGGKTYQTGDVLDGTYANNELTLTVEVSSGGATKSASFTIKVFSGITVEAENEYVEGTTGATESYTVFTRSKSDSCRKKTGANNAVAIENICVTDEIEFHIYSETAVNNAQIILRACSIDRKKDSNGTYDTPFNNVFEIYQEGTKIELGDDVAIKGRDAIAGESLWFVWTESLITTVNLKEGYNVIKIKCIGTQPDSRDDGKQLRVPNIDRIDVKW